MSVTPRTAWLVGALSVGAFLVPPPLVGLAIAALLGAAVVDALRVRPKPAVDRRLPSFLSRGVAAPVSVGVKVEGAGGVQVRQATPPDLVVSPSEGTDGLDATIVATRRGRHSVPPPAVRLDGPLGLGRWHHSGDQAEEVVVYPDMPAARRLALAVREGRFGEQGLRERGPLGLGTEFESIRDYLPDDDIRQVNWAATARMDRPMSNQYRVEQDRDLICLIDTGRLMRSPLQDRTRLDAAVDAATAVALVADEAGDRVGAIAFASALVRHVRPRRAGGKAVIHGIFDLEPTDEESDYELAFRTVGASKRSLVLVFTDLLEEAAARPLVDAVPVLARHHHVVVASATDSDLVSILSEDPTTPHDVYAAAVAVEVLEARERVAAALKRAGAQVLEAVPERLGAACVAAYLRAKDRARL